MPESFVYLLFCLIGMLAAGAYGYLLGYAQGHQAALDRLWRPGRARWPRRLPVPNAGRTPGASA